jgi:SpoVK/Ycf46/Vps4 family AAA+-type ATPase
VHNNVFICEHVYRDNRFKKRIYFPLPGAYARSFMFQVRAYID